MTEPALKSEALIKCLPGAVSLRVNWQEREADHKFPPTAEIKNDRDISPLPPYEFMA